MQTIHILSDETINQIAAGEVIENPASVVKELIENALDANATKIIIEITGGGLKLIRVTDDGMGMAKEEVHLSIVRHATSKITEVEDLFRILTKGFRGEALASIASISKMNIMTAREGESGAWLEIEKGKVLKKRSIARTKGTTVEVRSLFYNVPARKKFQKTAAALSAEIFRIVSVMGLSHPQVQFELISNQRKVIQTFSSGGLLPRTKELLGEDFVQGHFPVNFEEATLKFTGMIAAPTNTRSNKTGQYLFINHRYVSCSSIDQAIREGYGTRLDERRHPLYLLHLDVPSDLIDVNVHPQKLQVRLRKEELFRQKVQEAVEKALAKEKPPIKTQFSFPEPSYIEETAPFKASLLREAPIAIQQDLHLDEEAIQFIQQVGKYLCFYQESILLLLDLETALFRIIFEDLLYRKEQSIEKQGLLIPFSIKLTKTEAAMVLTHLDAIHSLGFELRPTGYGVFMVEAIPQFIVEKDVQSILSKMANDLQEFIGKLDYTKEREKKLIRSAASFVKWKKQYSREEANQLFKRLMTCKSPYHCPKGNLTILELSHDAIEDLFRKNQIPPKRFEKREN